MFPTSETGISTIEGKSNFARIGLFSMIIVISLSPRISLQFLDAEIRLQDVFIIPLVLYLLVSPIPREKYPVQKLFSNALPVFIYLSLIIVLLSVVFFPEVSILRRVTYYGRTIEIFVLAVVVAGLYLRSGTEALGVVLKGIFFGASLNLAWFLYQIVTGIPTTLLGQGFSSQIESYGPKLIGEPSAFGVGQYWAFIAAVAAAKILSGMDPWRSRFWYLASLWAAYLAESRISMGSILVIGGLLLILGERRRLVFNIMGLIVGFVLVIIGLLSIAPTLSGRFSREDIVSSLEVRVYAIWAPHTETILGSPLVGVGPGGLLGAGNLSEAHNILIRSMLDFGVIVGPLFIALFVIALIRSFKVARLIDVDRDTQVAGYMGFFVVLSALISGQMQDSLTAVMSSHLTMLGIGMVAAQHGVWHTRQNH